MPENIFIVGSTGYTGREVVRVGCERGLGVFAHIRPDSRQLKFWQNQFAAQGAHVVVAPWQIDALAAVLRDIQPKIVFSLLGTTRARMKDETKASYEKVDYGLTALLLRAVRLSGIQPKFVYLSAAGVRQNSRHPYLAVRYRFEKELAASGIPYLIARPSIITGPDRDDSRPLERVAAVVADWVLGIARFIGGKKFHARYRSTTNTILAEALLRLAQDPTTSGKVFESESLRTI